MKKNLFLFSVLFLLCVPCFCAESVTNTAEAAVSPEPAKEQNIFDAIGGLFAPSKPEDAAAQAEAATKTARTEAELQKEAADDALAMPGNLLVAADIFSAAACAVFWVGFSQGLDYYNEVYAAVDNTTMENYSMLVAMRKDVISQETSAWISTGVASAFLLYTAADLIWVHAVFPVKPAYSFREGAQIITLNYGF
jgi:hypothetical protein